MKNIYFPLSLLFLCTFSQLKAQTYEWTNTMGGADNDDLSYSVATDAQGNVYIAGTCANDSVDFDPSPTTAFLHAPPDRGIIGFIAKYDSYGNYLWARNTGQHEIVSMCLDPNANIFITGNFEDSTDLDPTLGTNFLYGNDQRDIYLIKYDSAGNFLWGHGFGGTDNDYGLKVCADNSGNAYITGYFVDTADFDPSPSVSNLTSASDWQGFLAKYDPSGNYLWAIGIGGSSHDAGRAIAVDEFDNIFVAGIFASTVDFDPSPTVNSLTSMGGADIFIAKYDASGNYIWAKQIGSSGSNETTSSIDIYNGNVFITGLFIGTVDFDPGPGINNLISAGFADVYYAKYDNAGNFIYAYSIGGSSDDRGNEIKTDSSGNVYITGHFRNTVDFDPGPGNTSFSSSGGSQDIFISKYSPTGNFIWVKAIGSSGEDIGQSIALSSTGDVYLTGWFSNTVDFFPGTPVDNHTSNGARDIFLTKYSNISTVVETTQPLVAASFKIYPTPTNGTLFCEVYETTQLFIYNTSGTVVFNQQLNAGKHTLDISPFANCLYLVRSSVANQSLVIIKQ